MIALLREIRTPDQISESPSIRDLHEMLADEAIRSHTRLWFDRGDNLVAFALVYLMFHNLMFEMRADLYSTETANQIIAWGLSQIETPGASLRCGCRSDEPNRLNLLQRHHFQEEGWRSLSLARSLAEPIPTPVLPPGFQIRALEGTNEVEALVQIHRAAFGTPFMTVEGRLAMMNVPDYMPELDLVAVAPSGQLAAYCMCSIDHQENAYSGQLVGYTDPVATHPDFQRLGLGRALLETGAHLLKQRGMEKVALGTSSENVPMQQLAMSVGYRVESEKRWFAKVNSADSQ
jgi:ribosomal protein S18 acetylase RimI-like enzyme